ncbi:MAG: DUF4340 domain-containing protein [Planctomycetaceae bacterium]|nr:DUF4340 domain-containing protein [Planctomycetaceae bacterium]
MKPKTAIALTLILVLCLGYILARHSTLLKPSSTAPADDLLLGAKMGKIVTFKITDAAGGAIDFARRGGDWYVERPYQAKAQAWRVDRIVNEIKTLAAHSAAGIENDLSGLDKPLWTITVTDETGKNRVVEIGRQTPSMGFSETRTYVHVPGHDPAWVAYDFAQHFSQPATAYRDKVFVDVATTAVTRITLSGRNSFELARKDGSWKIVAPITAQADGEAVDNLLRQACRIEAEDVVTADAKDLSLYGLAKGQESLLLTLWQKAAAPATQPATRASAPAETPLTVALGSRSNEQIYARRTDSPIVFLVNASLLEGLQPAVVSLRQRQVLDFDAAQVNEIAIEAQGKSAKLHATLGQWTMTAPYQAPATATQVSALLAGLGALKAEDFRDNLAALAGWGLATPRAVVSLALKDRKQRLTLNIGGKSPSGEMTFVQAGAGAPVAVVPTRLIDALPLEPTAYYNNVLLSIPAAQQLVGIDVNRSGSVFSVRKDPAGWKMLAPIATDADTENINKLFARLRELAASKIVFLGEQAPEKFLNAKEFITLTLKTSQPSAATAPATSQANDRTYTLRVVRQDDKVYAMCVGATPVCVGEMPKTFFEELSGELRSRSLWQIDSRSIREIRFIAGGDTFVVRKDGENWTYPKDPFVKLDTGEISAFLAGAGKLQAQAFVDYKTRDLPKYRLDNPWFSLELVQADGKTRRIVVSHIGQDKHDNRYAVIEGLDGIFTVTPKTAASLVKKLDDLKAKQ